MNYPTFTRELPHHLVFNQAAIARILRVPPRQINNWQCNLSNEVLVSLKDGGSAILKPAQMEEEFHRYRMKSGSDLEAYHAGQGYYGDRWDVRGSKGDIYQVEIVGDHYRCTCEDWHQHQTRCKHGWAVHFTIEATRKLSCHDCGHWTTNNGGHCTLRAKADLEQLPINHAEVCHVLIVGFEEF